jgi:hypothetical protein
MEKCEEEIYMRILHAIIKGNETLAAIREDMRKQAEQTKQEQNGNRNTANQSKHYR